jgi:hypothetical protein
MRIASATTQIGASPMAVWAILADLDRYAEWNPLFREASGQVAAGQRITLRTVVSGGGREMTIKPKVLTAAPGAELRWTAGIPGVIGGEHSFTLRAVDGGTELVQSETFRGLLAVVSGKTVARAGTSFRELNQALKARAESA